MSVQAIVAAFEHSASVGAARLVLLAMANEASSDGYITAYRRSQSWLARQANVDQRTVRRSIAQLVELGEVEVIAVGDGRAASDYRLHLPGLGATPDRPPTREGTPPAPPRAPRPTREGTPPAPSPPSPPTDARSVGTPREQLTLVPAPTPAALPAPAHVLGSDRDVWFARFWELYPRKVAKGAARTAWAAALRRGKARPEEIVAGAERYAADPNRDPAYTAHPATWLNAERWGDEPEPDRTTPATAGPPRTAMGKTMSHLRGLAAGHAAAPPPRQLGAG